MLYRMILKSLPLVETPAAGSPAQPIRAQIAYLPGYKVPL
jgi:hypothetical protein